jgi:hypothetical protein
MSDDGICGGDVPPLIGDVLTGTGLTLAQAAARLEAGEDVPALSPIQRRIVEDALTRASAEDLSRFLAQPDWRAE